MPVNATEAGTSAVEASTVDATAVEASAVDASRVEASAVEASAVEASAVEASAVEASAVEASAVEASAEEASAVEASAAEASAAEASAVEASAVEASAVEASAVETKADCYTDESRDYIGTRSTTESGLVCKRWDQLEPYQDFFEDDQFPDGSKCKAKNYCRDPGDFGYVWCYTEDPNPGWETCDVSWCYEPSRNNNTHDCYIITDKDRGTGMSEKEICESKPGGTKVCEESKNVPPGCEDCDGCCQEKDCYPACVRDYSGTWHRTETGRQCQHWDSQQPHKHPHNESHMFPEDQSVTAAQNYCRDPDNSGSLWCYTMDSGERREHCGIPEC